MTDPPARFVGVANERYATLRDLDGAVADTEELAGLLQTGRGFESALLADLEVGDLLGELADALAPGSLPGGRLIVSWVGHAVPQADNSLSLQVRSGQRDVEIQSTPALALKAIETGASQILLLLDTCHAGGALPEAATSALAGLQAQMPDRTRWFGVMAASRAEQTARRGLLIGEVNRLLANGPRTHDPAWTSLRPFVDGRDVLEAIVRDWPDTEQTPLSFETGVMSYDMVANPLASFGAEEPIGHLLFAARGTSTDDNYFSGRVAIIEEIVGWMERARPGIFLLTGPAGCGKSAIAGRVASLAASSERKRIEEREPIPPATDPGLGAVDAQLHCRGLTVARAVASLADQLRLADDANIHDVLGLAKRRRQGDPLVVVVDGLNEAGGLAPALLEGLIRPLAEDALLLITARNDDPGDEQDALLAGLGTPDQAVDVGRDRAATTEAVRGYVERRLRGIDDRMDPGAVAEALFEDRTDAPFLLARLVTAQLRESPVDTSGDGWSDELSRSVASALDHDLRRARLSIGGQPHETAAEELLRALTHAVGPGFPADDVWPRVANAISPTGTSYTRHDIYALIEALGHHLAIDTEGPQVSYRLAHERIIEHLRDGQGPGHTDGASATAASAIADLYDEFLDDGNAPRDHWYLWRYTWLHLATGGPETLDRLGTFVERDRDAFLPDLALGHELLGHQRRIRGEIDEAIDLLSDAVEIRRELGESPDLIAALLELATALTMSENPARAAAVTAEALDVADQTSDAGTRELIAKAFSVRAIIELRTSGRWQEALRLADRSVDLLEADLADAPWVRSSLALANALRAEAAVLGGDGDQATASSLRAIELVDAEDDERAQFPILIPALTTLLRVRLLGLTTTDPTDRTDGESGGDTSLPAEGRRLWRLVTASGPTDTVLDAALAAGLLMVAQLLLRDGVGPGDPEPAEVAELGLSMSAPLSRSTAEAALAHASLLGLQLSWSETLEEAERLLSEMEEVLRRFADSHLVASATLGLLLVGRAGALADGLEDGDDPQELIDLQLEAASRLEHAEHIALYRNNAATAFARLAVTAMQHGRLALELSARDRAIHHLRALQGDGRPQLAVGLAANLIDHAGRIQAVRPVRAIDLADEAVAILAALDDAADPRIGLFMGMAEVNGTLARINLGRDEPDLDRRMVEALAHLEPHDTPEAVAAMTWARVGQAALANSQGRHEDACRAAAAGLGLLDRPATFLPGLLPGPLLRVHLGVAEHQLGDAAGSTRLLEAIDELRPKLAAQGPELTILAIALNSLGPETWDEVLSELADHPALVDMLILQRRRPADELDRSVEELAEVLDRAGVAPYPDPRRLEEGQDGPLNARFARECVRTQRADRPEAFDRAWRERIGELPAWLTLDMSIEPLVVAWLNAGSLAEGRDFLLANPELVSDDAATAIEELRFDEGLAVEKVDAVIARLRLAEQVGPVKAYEADIARVLLDTWAHVDDAEDFLEANEDLMGGPVAAALDQTATTEPPLDPAQYRDSFWAVDATMRGILALVGRGERRLAFDALDGSVDLIPHLRQACRAGGTARLSALAAIGCQSDGANLPTRTFQAAAVSLAIAWAVDGHDARAATFLSNLTGLDEARTTELRQLVTDALQHNPDRALRLAPLLGALTAAQPDAVPGAVSDAGPQ